VGRIARKHPAAAQKIAEENNCQQHGYAIQCGKSHLQIKQLCQNVHRSFLSFLPCVK